MSTIGPKRGTIRRLWDFIRKPTATVPLGVLLVGGFAAGIVFWGGFNTAMEMTNREEFCVTCHEMRDNVAVEYAGTIHDANASGVRATCPDCHVPKEYIPKMIRKVQASMELYHHFMGDLDTPEKFEEKRLQLAQNVWNTMKKTDSRECRNCHSFKGMDLTQQEKRGFNMHLKAQEEGKTCIDCHKGIAHDLPRGANEAMRQFDAQWTPGGTPAQGGKHGQVSAVPGE